MGEQQPFRRPPTEVLTMAASRGARGRWRIVVSSRAEGDQRWDRLTLDDLSLVDCLEALHTHIEHRLL